MKTIKTLILGLVVVTSFSFQHKRKPKGKRKFFIMGNFRNGLARPSYVYGTLHMMCESDFTIKEKVKSI